MASNGMSPDRQTHHSVGVPETNKSLQALDNASFQWFHIKAILISGVGFFTDAYDLFIIGVITPMIGFAIYPKLHGKLPVNVDIAVKGTALVGTLCGQLLFGYLGDRGGRKSAYGWTLIIMIVATILGVSTSIGTPESTIGVFCMWRFILGVGIGGDYPLSAVITSEYAATNIRGRMVAAVFSMQGIGQLMAATMTVIVTSAMKSQIEECVIDEPCAPLNTAWRIIVGLGVLPAMATWYLRTRLPETPRFTVHVSNDEAQAAADVSFVMNNTTQLSLPAEEISDKQMTPAAAAAVPSSSLWTFLMKNGNWKVLFGCASAWFLLDVAYYSQNLFLPIVLTDIGYVKAVKVSADIFPKVFKTAAGNAIITSIGTVPGYYFTVAFVEIMGRKTIQIMGFIMMTILLALMAILFDILHTDSYTVWGFIVMYALTFFFANFGPNSTTFIIPGECFPTRFRATLHGICAATGKAGAIVGVYGFGPLFQTKGTKLTVGMLSIFMFAGLCTTWFVPETKGKTLEELGEAMDRDDSDNNNNNNKQVHGIHSA